MTGFRKRRPSGIAALAAILLLPAAASAQGSGPLRLIPQLPGTESSAPAQPRLPESPPPGGFQVESLGAIDPGAFGLLREQDGGLPRSLWRGSERAQIERLLSQVRPSVSPVALTLTRRLLLSEAELPAGKAGQPGLFSIRIDRLVAIGDPDGGFQLARMAANDPAAQMPAIDAAFASGRDDEACRLVAAVAGDRRDANWARSSAFCRAIAGDTVGAGIQTGLLRERGEADAPFVTLMASITGLADTAPVDLKAPSSLHLAMLRAAKRIPTSATIDALGPAGARLVADVEGMSTDIALRALERAYLYGAAPVEDLRNAYEKIQFKPQELAAALAGKPVDDARGRAAAYQAVALADGEAAKVRALSAALGLLRSREGGLDARMAAVHLETLRSLPPAATGLALAPRATRLLLASGQTGPAAEWFRLMEWQGRTGAIEPAREAVRLVPLFRLTDRSGARFAPGELVDWIDAWRAGSRPDNFDSRAVTMLSALQGLGFDVGPEVWDKLAAATAPSIGRRPNAATIQALRTAAYNGRIGETVLLALVALDGQSAASLEADALATVLDSLIRVDLEADARALAIEAAIGLGL